jgi:hypothetical protein
MKSLLKKLQAAAAFALAYAKFKVSKSAPNFLDVLSSLQLSKWEFYADYAPLNPFTPEFSLSDAIASVQDRKLLLRFAVGTGEKRRNYVVRSVFKNNGTDELTVNGIVMKDVSFDFDVIGVKNTLVQIELRYRDPEGVFHYDRLFNQL